MRAAPGFVWWSVIAWIQWASLGAFGATSPSAAEPFDIRGYYLTFMRMPVMGLPEWKSAIDCFAEDGVNTLILWTAGGFRSRKFPITWQYNQDHANVRQDFLGTVIEYAHTKRMRVLLGFTPFGYDGVNRYALEHPELKARQADGRPVDEFGIHCWGWNLCPAQPGAQRFMREYISEMLFEFYPEADGLLIESSDYSICHCAECGPHYYDHEFAFVRWLSNELWQRKPTALILVYPHYFTGQKVPGLNATAARQTFDPRWGLFFTPHSAHFDADLIQQAQSSVFWSPAPALGTPRAVAEAALAARRHGVNGFMPSLEAFSFVASRPEGGEPWLVGQRLKPCGLDPLAEGRMPYDDLLPRVQRAAFREFSQDPSLPFDQFKHRLGSQLWGKDPEGGALDDLLELQRIWNFESDWYRSSPLLEPEFFRQRAERLHWSAEKRAAYRTNLERLREIAARHAPSQNPIEREMAKLAGSVVDRWAKHSP